MVKLESLLETIKTNTVNIGFLKKRVPKNVEVVNYIRLKGRHRTDVFRNKRALIVLIPKKGTKTGHFISLIPRASHIEYFSSLGGSPFDELEKLHESSAIFDTLLGKHFIYNKIQLQSGKYNINSCASWVIARCFLSHLKLRDFTELFTRKFHPTGPDDIVSLMVLLHFIDN